MMPPSPTVICRVLRQVRFPIVANPGDLLAVWPGHPELTLSVLTGDAEVIRRACYVPERVLHAEVFNLYLDGAIQPASPSDEDTLLRSA